MELIKTKQNTYKSVTRETEYAHTFKLTHKYRYGKKIILICLSSSIQTLINKYLLTSIR